MKLAMHVHHVGDVAWAAAVAFDDWAAPEPTKTYLSRIAPVEPVRRGELDLRALPALLHLLREHKLTAALILIDGAVHLDAQETPGLGAHLYRALEGHAAVIGVSKSAMPGLPQQFEVMREEETRPLLVTCAGIDLGAAKIRLRGMHGKRRIPTLMKRAARLAKSAADPDSPD